VKREKVLLAKGGNQSPVGDTVCYMGRERKSDGRKHSKRGDQCDRMLTLPTQSGKKTTPGAETQGECSGILISSKKRKKKGWEKGVRRERPEVLQGTKPQRWACYCLTNESEFQSHKVTKSCGTRREAQRAYEQSRRISQGLVRGKKGKGRTN